MKERIASPSNFDKECAPKIGWKKFFATATLFTSILAAFSYMEGAPTPVPATLLTGAFLSIIGEILSIKSNH
jgi:hypothetical protein